MKNTWQQIVYAILFSLVLDAIGAYILAYLVTDRPSEYFWLYAAIIVIVPLPLALWSLAKRWVFFHLSGKEALTRVFLRDFHQHGFPPTDGEFDIDSYLLGITQDKSVTDDARMTASSLIGQLVAARSLGGFSSGIMMTIAAQNAMQRYQPVSRLSDISLDDGFFGADEQA